MARATAAAVVLLAHIEDTADDGSRPPMVERIVGILTRGN
jgi:hypothetical protein